VDPKVLRLRTPADCENFATNVEVKYPTLAQEARRRSVELRAESFGAKSEAEREAIQAVYAYEEVLSRKNGKKTHASRTWQMIKRYGLIDAVQRAVCRKEETMGYTALVDVGMQDFAFECVVLRYPNLFSAEAIAISKSRVLAWNTP
jgi:hypothetical protein